MFLRVVFAKLLWAKRWWTILNEDDKRNWKDSPLGHLGRVQNPGPVPIDCLCMPLWPLISPINTVWQFKSWNVMWTYKETEKQYHTSTWGRGRYSCLNREDAVGCIYQSVWLHRAAKGILQYRSASRNSSVSDLRLVPAITLLITALMGQSTALRTEGTSPLHSLAVL